MDTSLTKMNKNKLQCLFGIHEYKIPNKKHPSVLMCGHCMRHGHRKDYDGIEEWFDYDENGNMIHWKDSDGFEVWCDYDENGNMIQIWFIGKILMDMNGVMIKYE